MIPVPVRVTAEQLTPRSPLAVRWWFGCPHPTLGPLTVSALVDLVSMDTPRPRWAPEETTT